MHNLLFNPVEIEPPRPSITLDGIALFVKPVLSIRITVEQSVARQCLAGLGLDHAPFIDVEFLMDNDRRQLGNHYQTLAAEIATRIRAGQKVGYLTIGDSLTYSTYGYVLAFSLCITSYD